MSDKIDTKVYELSTLVESSSEEEVNQLLSSFSCEKNPHVQNYLHHKAILNEQRCVTKTYLVINSEEPYDIVGFFSYNISSFVLEDEISNSSRKYVTGFKNGHRTFPTLLLCQFGRADRYKGVVSGDYILTSFLSLAKVIAKQTYIRTVSIEYDADNDFLDDYYTLDINDYEKKYEKAKLYCFHKIQLNKKPDSNQFLAALRIN
ncbi:MAG: hypothetical protein ABF629_07770 [Sporolactobacillus sp.]